MPAPYTDVAKPTGASYTNVNALGKEGFDDASVSFDSADTFFDGGNGTAWTNVSKPLPPGYDIAWSAATTSWAEAYYTWDTTDINEYTNVSKPI